MRSFDSAFTWTKTLRASETFTVFATEKGVVVAGGRGKVFYSTNFGRTWDSSRLNYDFPMTQFVADTEGVLWCMYFLFFYFSNFAIALLIKNLCNSNNKMTIE